MIYRFGEFELDTERVELRASGAPVAIERQVFDILALLVENRDRMVPREELQDRIWGDRFVSDAALSTRIMAARRALGDTGREQRFIKTVHGRGFRFVADVRRQDGAAAAPGARCDADGRPRRAPPLSPDAPAIQYRRTEDGVNLAHWSWGSGRPMIVLPDWIWSHIRSELRLTEVARWYGELASRWRLVRYDGRGEGLSDRDAPDYSLEARVRDLDTITAAYEPGVIFAHVSGTLTAMAFAARHPDRVTHLVLWCGYSRAEEFGQTPQLRALLALVRNDWDMFVENIARSRITGWSSRVETEGLTRYLRDAANPDYAETAMASLGALDVGDILGRVKTPTLVVHCSGVSIPSIDASRRLAAGIPGAQLRVLEQNAPIPHLGPTGPAIRVLEEFLGES
jgi:DNA-binding winged helix-turn-helix (wHTH) protein/pimeloyl-ACP methyl ester carboxylesterase